MRLRRATALKRFDKSQKLQDSVVKLCVCVLKSAGYEQIRRNCCEFYTSTKTNNRRLSAGLRSLFSWRNVSERENLLMTQLQVTESLRNP